jgi:hypothetical protein
MMLAFASMVLIAIVSSIGLEYAGFSSKEQYSSENVRLD